MIEFIAGLFLGSIGGMTLMALLFMAGEDDYDG